MLIRYEMTMIQAGIGARTIRAALMVLTIAAMGCDLASAQDLRVIADGMDFRIQNRDTGPVTIKDILVNDRDDCSTFDDIFLRTFPEVRGKFDKQTLHRLWVMDWVPGSDPSKSEYRQLQIGEERKWRAACGGEIIRIKIDTDKGSSTYRLQ